MGLIQWAISPWGRTVPIHIAWYLIWICAIAGLKNVDARNINLRSQEVIFRIHHALTL